MTHVLIDTEVVKVTGLSVIFMGVMLSIVLIGIIFFIYRLSKNKREQYLKMAGLITAWVVFIVLDVIYSKSIVKNYQTVFLNYSLMQIITTSLGIIIILSLLFTLPKLLKIFNGKLLFWAGSFAGLSVLERIIFPFLREGVHYLGLIHRITMIIPILMSFFMIVGSYINGAGGQK